VAACVEKSVLGCIWDHHFTGREGRRGSAIVPFERAMVSYRLSIVTTALSLTIRLQFAIKYLLTLKLTGVGNYRAKFGKKGLTNVSQILTRSETCSSRMQKKSCQYFLSFEHNERTRQTYRPRNSSIDTNRRDCFSATSPKNAVDIHYSRNWELC